MKFGVIICPKCKKSKGVILTNKTTRCIRCGKELKLNKIRILFKTNSEVKLREYIRSINEKLENR